MAYTHSKYEVLVGADKSLASTGDIADWSPGLMPHIIRGVALVITNAVGSDAVVKVDKRPTAGSDTGRGDGDVATLTLNTTNGALGKSCYVAELDVEIVPGQEVVFEVTDAGSAGDTAHLILYVEPRWEVPQNNPNMNSVG